MQVMAEALGLMLPGTALMPATASELKKAAYDAGKQLMKLVEMGIAAKDIVTMESLENAIMVHAAISGSTNAVMHIPAIAHEFGFEIDADTFDRMAPRCTLSAKHPSGRRLACTVFLLCRRCAESHGRNQEHAPS